MSNIQKNMTVVSKEIDYVFSSKCTAFKTMNTQYDKTYEYTGAAAGSTINIMQPYRVIVTDGRSASSVPDSEERTIQLPRATWKKVMLNFNAEELALDLTKAENASKFFGKTKLASSVQSLAGVVDQVTYSNLVPQVYNFTRGGETTDISSYGDIGKVKAKLDDYHADDMDRL